MNKVLKAMDVLITNKDVGKVKNFIHIAVHFPMGMSKVCNKISIIYNSDKVSVKIGVQNSCRYLSTQLEHSSNV